MNMSTTKKRQGLGPNEKNPSDGDSGENSNYDSESKAIATSFLDWLYDHDTYLTYKLGVCATKESPLGHLRPLMKFIEITCHGVPWLILTFVLMLKSHIPQTQYNCLNLFAALVFDLAVVGTLKTIFSRPRPAHNKMDMFATVSIDNYSFPSGHSTRAAMMAYLLIHKLSPGTWLAAFLVIWSFTVCASRVFLGRHHVSDVICGFVIGLIQYIIVRYLWIPDDICDDLIRHIAYYTPI